jgi:hypothetical protein
MDPSVLAGGLAGAAAAVTAVAGALRLRRDAIRKDLVESRNARVELLKEAEGYRARILAVEGQEADCRRALAQAEAERIVLRARIEALEMAARAS